MQIQQSAIDRLQQLLQQENDPDAKFRVFVQGGGCSGFQYGFTFDNQQNEDDFDFHYGDLTVLVDSMSMQYLQGAEITYAEDDMGAAFAIVNPNAQTTCGCGSSFSPYS